MRMVYLIKSIHTFAFLVISACIVYMLYCGFTGQITSFLPIAIAVVILEMAVYVLNGFHCPLTDLTKKYGDEAGHDFIADIFLPIWFIPWIVPLCSALATVAFISVIITWWNLN